MANLRSGAGEAVRLGAEIGRGGEGTVFSIQGQPALAAKIYRPEIAQERQHKIEAMKAAKWQTSDFVAFPLDTLSDAAGAFCGFSMPKVGGHKAVHELYSPAGRKSAFPKATYPFLVRCAVNIARAMAGIHATGCVIGDINHSGILVSETATVTFIDADSFQVQRHGQLYPCKVGVQEFTPPELQGKPLDKVIRTENHDGFGLAVLLFYTLFMGRHPYAGRYLGSGDMPMDRAITEFRFAYSGRRAATQMEAPPNVPGLADLPLALADAFELAFGSAGSCSARPNAKDWIALLTDAEADLVRCTANTGHHYFRQSNCCPWCRMEKAYPGFQAFPAIMPAITGSTPVNLAQLINAVRNVPDPGPTPPLSRLLSIPPGISATPAAEILRSFRVQRLSAAMLCGAASVAATVFQSSGSLVPLIGFGTAAIAGLSAFSGTGSRAAIDKRLIESERAWQDKEAAFSSAAGNQLFLRIRTDAFALVTQLENLPSDEQKRLSDLAAKVRQAQFTRFLEGHSIKNAKVKGLGEARKITLRSYGIETAADVERGRIERVHGFGHASASALIVWRRSVEGKFRFDPKRGVDPRDIAGVKADVAKRRVAGEARLNTILFALRKASSDAVAIRAGPLVNEHGALAALEQARLDLRASLFGPRDRHRLMLVAFVSLLVCAFPHVATFGQQRLPSAPHTGIQTEPLPSVLPKPIIVQPSVEKSGDSVARSPHDTRPMDQEAYNPSQAVNEPQKPDVIVPQLPPPREIELVPNGPPPADAVPLLDLADKADAVRVQQALRELGFLKRRVDGVWGPQSRAALREFRISNRIGNDDSWDVETQERLFDFRW